VAQTLLHQGPRFELGEFRCAPGDSRWRCENVIGRLSIAAFPITSVVIRHDGADPLLANPNHVVFYRERQRYHRVLHDARGDHCLFVGFDARAAADVLESAGVTAGEVPFAHGPSPPKEYLHLRLVAEAARAGRADALAVEEAMCDALSAAIEAGTAVHRVRRGARPITVAEHRRLVERTKHELTERATARDSLSSLAAGLNRTGLRGRLRLGRHEQQRHRVPDRSRVRPRHAYSHEQGVAGMALDPRRAGVGRKRQ
jgi:hypothetical protein